MSLKKGPCNGSLGGSGSVPADGVGSSARCQGRLCAGERGRVCAPTVPAGSAPPAPPRAALAQQRGRAAHTAPASPPNCLQLQPAPPSASPAAPHSISASSPLLCGPGPRRAWQWCCCFPLALLERPEFRCLSSPLLFPLPHCLHQQAEAPASPIPPLILIFLH